MNHNKGNKTLIKGMEELLPFENTEHLERKSGGREKRKYIIPEATNKRVVILLGDYEKPKYDRYKPQSKYSNNIEIDGSTIIAPEGTQITIIGGKNTSIDCPKNDVRFYKGGDIVTRHNTGLVHGKSCKNITAHQNNIVMVRNNTEAYAKWNEGVLASGNDELYVFNNNKVVIQGNKLVNPGIHGGLEGIHSYNDNVTQL